MADPGGQRRPRVRPRRLRTGFRAEDEGQPQPRGSPPWPRWQGAAEQADPDPGGRAEAETREAALARSSHGPRLPSPRVFISPLPIRPREVTYARGPSPGRPGVRLEGAPRCAAPWGDAGAQACPPLPVVLAQPLDGVESPLPHTRCPLGDFASLPPTCTGRWATGPSGVWRDARPASVWCLRRARPAGVRNPLLFLPSPLVPPRVLLTRCFAVQRHLATKTGAFPSLPTDCATTSTSSSLARPARRSLFAPATTSLSRDSTRTLGAAAHLMPHGAGTGRTAHRLVLIRAGRFLPRRQGSESLRRLASDPKWSEQGIMFSQSVVNSFRCRGFFYIQPGDGKNCRPGPLL